MMALYVASHYKNSPNDLQLMADAPAHHLFVLLGIPFLHWSFFFLIYSRADGHMTPHSIYAGPVDESRNHLPDILCVIQVYYSSLCGTLANYPYTLEIWCWCVILKFSIWKMFLVFFLCLVVSSFWDVEVSCILVLGWLERDF